MATQRQPSTSSNLFSFLSKGWREGRDSADADLRLMRDRANSFKNLTISFDRELENFFNSTPPPFSVATMHCLLLAEIEFVKKLQPKLSNRVVDFGRGRRLNFREWKGDDGGHPPGDWEPIQSWRTRLDKSTAFWLDMFTVRRPSRSRSRSPPPWRG